MLKLLISYLLVGGALGLIGYWELDWRSLGVWFTMIGILMGKQLSDSHKDSVSYETIILCALWPIMWPLMIIAGVSRGVWNEL